MCQQHLFEQPQGKAVQPCGQAVPGKRLRPAQLGDQLPHPGDGTAGGGGEQGQTAGVVQRRDLPRLAVIAVPQIEQLLEAAKAQTQGSQPGGQAVCPGRQEKAGVFEQEQHRHHQDYPRGQQGLFPAAGPAYGPAQAVGGGSLPGQHQQGPGC